MQYSGSRGEYIQQKIQFIGRSTLQIRKNTTK